MNYYEPRQVSPNANRPDAGKWRYTCMNDGQIWPVGYCAQDCPGHDTPEEARAHQTEYLMNERVDLDGRWRDAQHKCEQCDAWTDRYANVDNGATFNLCDTHRTRETVAALYGSAGDVISSY